MDDALIEEHSKKCQQVKSLVNKHGMRGEWDNEPNRVNWRHAGLDCMLVRAAHSLNWCGYVGVPRGHMLFGVNYSDEVGDLKWAMKARMDKDASKEGRAPSFSLMIAVLGGRIPKSSPDNVFAVHGGVTFAGPCNDVICHKSDDEVWWFGFDTSHSGDYSPGFDAQIADSSKDRRIRGPMFGDTYKNQAFATSETEDLAEQISRVEMTLPVNRRVIKKISKLLFTRRPDRRKQSDTRDTA